MLLSEAALCVVSLGLLLLAGWAFVNTRLYREESERDACAQVLFCTTFALSVFLLLLILFDMTEALSPSALRLTWRLALYTLLAAIMVATPFYLFYIALCADGAAPVRGALGAAACLAAALRVFWTAGDGAGGAALGAHRAASAPSEDAPPVVMERVMSRVGVVGVCLLAVLTGFGAVYIPYASLSVFVRRTDAASAAAVERRLLGALHALVTKRKRAALDADAVARAAAASTAADAQARAAGAAATALGRAVRWLGCAVRNARSSSSLHGSPSAAALAAATALEVDTLDALTRSLAEEAAAARAAAARAAAAGTLRGRVDDACGAAMALFCVHRVYRSARHLLLRERDADAAQAAAALVARGGGVGGGGALASAAAALHLRAADLGQLLSLLLVGIVVAQSVRNFLVAVDGVAAAARFRRGRGGAAAAGGRTRLVLFVAEVMGLYFVSSVLLIRPRLPPRQRAVISAALGADVPFSFYEDFNDGVFIAAAAASAAYLVAQHRVARSMDTLAGSGGGSSSGGGDVASNPLAALAAGFRTSGSASKRSTD